VTENLKGIVIDEAYRITDQTALSIVYQLMREEGIFVGLSSGINAAGALRLAREGGVGQVIVTLLCDSASAICRSFSTPSGCLLTGWTLPCHLLTLDPYRFRVFLHALAGQEQEFLELEFQPKRISPKGKVG